MTILIGNEVLQVRQRIAQSVNQVGCDGPDGAGLRSKGQLVVGAQQSGGALLQEGAGLLQAPVGPDQRHTEQ